jgi:hypothetical protein
VFVGHREQEEEQQVRTEDDEGLDLCGPAGRGVDKDAGRERVVKAESVTDVLPGERRWQRWYPRSGGGGGGCGDNEVGSKRGSEGVSVVGPGAGLVHNVQATTFGVWRARRAANAEGA